LIEKAFANEKTIAVPHYLSCNDKNYPEQDGGIWRICGYIKENPNAENKNYSYGYAVGRFLRVVNTSHIEFENTVNLHNFGLNLPIRNIHGDTKIDNIIFGEKITIIDFDTAMRGYICTDYGDMVRSATNKSFDLQTVYQITEGFADGLDGLLTKSEIDSLYSGIILVTTELAGRYHAGNKNFPNKTHEECRERENQLNLQLDEFYRHKNDIIKIIDECFS
ncbi:MAG: aminoglycoside phosphotransferase family protein, partial [Ruminococcus sp.]|nr:aminoglycoside phosphotransferase family protein [Ruminococcus sp.]